MKKVFIVICAVIISFIVSPNRNFASTENSGAELKLYLGEAKIIAVNNPTRIVIGNPAIMDVANVSKTEMTLNPKALGKTILMFWDNFGEQSFQVKVLSENLEDVKLRIDSILKKINFPTVYGDIQEDEGKVLLLGTVKTAQEREQISIALGTLKDKIVDLINVKEEEAVIEIDVQVLELDKDATNTLGFSWPGSLSLVERSSQALTSSGTDLGGIFRISKFMRATISNSTVTENPFNFILDMLVQEGKARVLSRPRLACQSGKEAEMLVGGEKPLFTTTVAATTGAQGTQIEYKEFGIKLKIKPTVTEQEKIKLALKVEVSEVGAPETIGASTAPTAKAYPLTKRTAATELVVENGQTLSIGGLIKQKDEEDVRKVPFLGDTPILGGLFRKKTTKSGGGQGERGNTELYIALTPRIVTPHEKVSKAESEKDTPLVSVANTVSVAGPEGDYAKIIQRRILKNLSYPDVAKQAGFQGTVKLSLHLSYTGQLLETAVKSSSGHKVLDDYAVSIAKQIASYPPFPPSIEEKELWIDVPIVYHLD